MLEEFDQILEELRRIRFPDEIEASVIEMEGEEITRKFQMNPSTKEDDLVRHVYRCFSENIVQNYEIGFDDLGNGFFKLRILKK